eukprot:CAMPEP_0177765858 /NCGR_PEP_ID=MMETSP0491_2-20121128/8210_1 /TAXON_ID=63592 /ORGANISM="Tetraselmis chuii, Strain PLY429" /LENGTH=190 /DNA_ID=CAMNT_0019282223 /DNA_START=137 /DNA_END=709 /DNA_ORIENTATION=+
MSTRLQRLGESRAVATFARQQSRAATNVALISVHTPPHHVTLSLICVPRNFQPPRSTASKALRPACPLTSLTQLRLPLQGDSEGERDGGGDRAEDDYILGGGAVGSDVNDLGAGMCDEQSPAGRREGCSRALTARRPTALRRHGPRLSTRGGVPPRDDGSRGVRQGAAAGRPGYRDPPASHDGAHGMRGR